MGREDDTSDRKSGGAFGYEVAYPDDPEDGHSRGASGRLSSPGIASGPKRPEAGDPSPSGSRDEDYANGKPFVWWQFESRCRGGWAVCAFGWCMCVMVWFLLAAAGAINTGTPSKWAMVFMSVPVPLLLVLHFMEVVAHRGRTVLLTHDTVAFPAHGLTARVVELPLSEIVTVQLRTPRLLSPLRAAWAIRLDQCFESVRLQHRSGGSYSISAFYLPSHAEFLELKRSIEGAVACY